MSTLMTAENPGRWKRRCDATCHDATKPDCSCICGGMYHGKKSGSPELREAVNQYGAAVLEKFQLAHPEAAQHVAATLTVTTP